MNHEKLNLYIGACDLKIVDAMKKIDNNSCGILFIVDENDHLIGALSDGDVRRWLINTADLKASVVSAMNKHPKYLISSESDRVQEVMDKYLISVIPIIDEERHIIDIFNDKRISEHNELLKDTLKGTPIVMMAGGRGTRLYPYTKILPKPLIPIGDKPISEIIINSFEKYGCNDFFLIVNHKKNMIKAYFSDLESRSNIIFIEENKPLGTGGGLALLKGLINKTFILTNCDNVINDNYHEIFKFHKDQHNLITMICSLKTFNIPYGVVKLADNGMISSMEEKPSFSYFVNTGCYIVEPEVINDIPFNTSIGFPEIIEMYRSKGNKVGAYPINENSWLDMGEISGLESMTKLYENK